MEPITDNNNDIDEAILLRYIRKEATPEEVSIIESWAKKDSNNEKELMQLAKIYYAQLTKKHIVSRNTESAFAKVESKIRQKRRSLVIRQICAVAAMLTLLISVSAITHFMTKGGHTNVQYVTIKSNAGMRTNFNLPDGTVVCLNSGSSLTYPMPFEENKRSVELEGEGFFNVTHNTKRPFIVKVLNDVLQIEVTGTRFNVQAYSSDETISTTLVDGKIKLATFLSNGQRIMQPIKPSERAIYDKNKKDLYISQVNTSFDTAWMDGKLMFKDTPLPEVMKRLSHFYNVSFEIKDPIINSYEFTGTFDNRQLSQVLDYLHISSLINYQIIQTSEDDSRKTQRTKVILSKQK